MKAKLTRLAVLARHSAVRTGAALALFPFALAARAADGDIDITAATAGISAAKTAVLAVVAAMIVMMAAVWGVKKVLRLFGR